MAFEDAEAQEIESGCHKRYKYKFGNISYLR
ncbi:uncharacterized protein G2W53_032958 [Senna tora]|uniref:Uncharacterized protein n=1 Tax=Senna tora TaxID=362788 RepID=A0A834T1D1_9FABA|nr:uncharacterized protein G2W53_032958 [Senna tora]